MEFLMFFKKPNFLTHYLKSAVKFVAKVISKIISYCAILWVIHNIHILRPKLLGAAAT